MTTSLPGRVDGFIHGPRAQGVITAVILFNALILGLETWPRVMAAAGPLLIALDRVCLAIFVIEIGLKLYARGLRFFRDGWNVFDFIVVGIAVLPAT
ncbi:MAG: ion transporter, partial [Paracoccus marcusii]